MLPIAAVERDTGLSKDTLRVWERRYGFPQPGRDATGERLYPAEQVERLRVIARLLNAGERPGQIVALPLAELRQRLQANMPLGRGLALEHEALLTMLRRCEIMDLRRTLNQAIMRMGLARFITEQLAPLTVHVGQAWMRGEIQVFEEHMYTESVVAVLRGALGGSSTLPGPGMPRVLLGTLPHEHHLLGLLMAEAMLSLEGCECVSLGANTPVPEIVRAAQANRAQIVGLSFSPVSNTPQLQQGLLDLRAQLPPHVQIWAGGSHPALRKRLPTGVIAVERLEDIPALLAAWQAQTQVQAA
ncbi:MAG: cobalamin-dependent protein [Curvibacter sp.]